MIISMLYVYILIKEIDMNNYLVFKIYTFALLLAGITTSVHSYNIILDLHGVCVITDTNKALSYLPKLALCSYTTLLKQSPRASLYKILHKIEPAHHTDTTHYPHDEEGKPLPTIMHKWLNGTVSSVDILQTIKNACAQHPEWFYYSVEKTIVLAMARMIFTPQSFIDIHTLAPNALRFVEQCKRAGHTVYILSNWDSTSFDLLKKKYHHFFQLCDGIVISGDMNCSKPHPDIYEQTLKKYNLNKEETIFVDDQAVNIAAAQAVGITSILCPTKKSWISSTPDLTYVFNTVKRAHNTPVTFTA